MTQQRDSFEYFIEESERRYWGAAIITKPAIEYLSYYIEKHKTFCEKVNNLRCNADFTDFVNIMKLREALHQSTTLFTELVGERFRIEHKISLMNIREEEPKHLEYDAGKIKFPSSGLLADSMQESTHIANVIKLSRAMVSTHATQNNLIQINMYLYDIKTKIQEMATTNHDISTFIIKHS